MHCESLLCVPWHVARARTNYLTYIYFEILLVCSLAWEKTIAVVNLFIVDAIRWNRG
jgi:hypothetical protein